MSVRLFHRGARLVLPARGRDGAVTWRALHRRPIDWARLFEAPLRLLGYRTIAEPGGVRFGDGSLHWTTGAMWTTIRLRLPPCSERKAALLAAGLLKAARYAQLEEERPHAQRQ